jgi:hypothetical protein
VNASRTCQNISVSVVTDHCEKRQQRRANGKTATYSGEVTVAQWTNATLRAHLGERGFLQEGNTVTDHDRSSFSTLFRRGSDELILVEFKDEREPVVMQNGVEVEVQRDLGWRNSQIQHDKLKGD